MRLTLWILLLFFLHFQVQGQNLVPNPSFEDYSQCPNSQDQLDRAVGWFKPTANSSDYFNACFPDMVFGQDVPHNFLGYQNARTGNAYAGFCPYYYCSGDCREYISTQLIQPLEANVRYCVSFYVSLADSSLDAIAPIGAYFSNVQINDQSSITNLPYTPQINYTIQPLRDTMNWMLITGSFVATGGENYIIIGTFSSDAQLQIDTVRDNGQPIQIGAYYYVDDVSVVRISDCVAGNDSTICFGDSLQLGTLPDSDIVYSWLPATGLSNASIANPKASPFLTTTYTLTQTQCDVTSTSTVTVTVKHDCNTYPRIIVPSSFFGNQQVLVLGLESGSQLEIYDARGRRVYNAIDYQNDFWTAGLAAGIYVVRLTRPNQQTIVQKIGVVR